MQVWICCRSKATIECHCAVKQPLGSDPGVLEMPASGWKLAQGPVTATTRNPASPPVPNRFQRDGYGRLQPAIRCEFFE
jgi:hypothetical protein